MKFLKILLTSAFLFTLTSVSAAIEDPLVSEPQIQRASIRPGETTGITVEASSPLSLPLTFIWNSVSGTIQGEGTRAIYTAPKTTPLTGFDTITVSVRDSEGRVTTRANLVTINASDVPGSLRFEPEIITATTNQISIIKIWMETGNQSVDTAELVIKFNPLLTKIEQIVALPLFSQIKDQEIKDDTISFTLQGDPFKGSGAIAEIHFTPLDLGQAEFSFDHTLDQLSDSNLFLLTESATDLLLETTPGLVNITNTSSDVEYRYVYEYTDEEAPSPKKTPDVGPGLDFMVILTLSGVAFLASPLHKSKA